MTESMTHRVARYCVDAGRYVTSAELAAELGATSSGVCMAIRRLERIGGTVKKEGRTMSLKIQFIPESISDGRWIKEVVAVNGSGDTIEFSSIRETVRAGFTKSCVMRAVERGTTYAGYKWRLAGDVKWSRTDIRELYDGFEPAGKTPSEIADMRARLGIRLPPSVMKRKQIQADIMACRITIDWAAEKYNTTPDKILKIMGW